MRLMPYLEVSKQETDEIVIPSGYWDLDYGLLMRGGFLAGRLVEFFGPESGGKSVLSYRVLSHAQKMGLKCLLIDSEHAVGDSAGQKWLVRNGVDIENLYYSNDIFVEDVFELMLTAMSDGVQCIVADSMASWASKVEMRYYQEEGHDFASALLGIQGRIARSALPHIRVKASETNTLIIIINQIRDRIGGSPWENTETTPGGHAWKHEFALRLRISPVGGAKGLIKEGDEVIGNYARVEVVKSKISPPNRATGKDTPFHLAIYYDGRELDEIASLVVHAKNKDLIQQSGAWLSWKDIKAQGIDNFVEKLREQHIEEEFKSYVKSQLSADE